MPDANPDDAELFAEALRLPPAERAAFLDGVCGADAERRRRVDQLLEAQSQLGNFLEQANPDSGFSIAAASLEENHGRVGRYRLIEKLGEGGCGVVYLAEQDEPVRRQVALKIIKPGMDTKEVIARFEAERQALALMDHPGIAKVFDAGQTESGRPYFVMELIRGTKITDFCDREALPTEERLKLFAKVCQAIQHAHQKGVIHRDIKPSNILVTVGADGQFQPVVIDFGIAKATLNVRLTDKTFFTAVEMLVGTPTYMSPEQASGTGVDVDTRSDIYALGVLLYELLTGTTPFDAGELLQLGIDEVRRAIREREPLRPSARLGRMTREELTTVAQRRRAEPPSLLRATQGDLDWIVMKCLEKDRTRRYETANGLAVDVGRLLANEVISARPASRWYRLGKAVRRHRGATAFLSAIVLLVALGLALLTASLKKERQLRAEAEAAKRIAEENQKRATGEALKSRQVSQFLQKVLLGASPFIAQGQDTTVLRGILDSAAEKIRHDLAGQPQVQAELQLRIGKVYTDLQQWAKGEAQYRAALAVLAQETGLHREASAQILYELGTLLIMTNRLEEAKDTMVRSLALRREEFGPEHPAVAQSLNQLARVEWRLGQLKVAEPLFAEALALRRRLLPADHRDITDSLSDLAALLESNDGTLAEAEELQRELVQRWRQADGPFGRNIDGALSLLARTMRRTGKVADAEAPARESVDQLRRIKGNDDFNLAYNLYGLALTLAWLGRLEEAKTALHEALAFREKLMTSRIDFILPLALALLSQIEEVQGNLEGGEQLAWEAFRLSRQQRGEASSYTAVCAARLTGVQASAGKTAEADALLAELLPAGSETLAPNFHLLNVRARYHARRGAWHAALADAARMVAHQPDNFEAEHLHAALLLADGQVDRFPAACDALLARYGASRTPFIAARVALLALMQPRDDAFLQRLSPLIRTAGAGTMGAYWSARAQLARALHEYRSGRFEAALTTAAATPAEARADIRTLAEAVRAMALVKLDRRAEARSALERARAFSPSTPGTGDLGADWQEWYEIDLGQTWNSRLYVQTILREAAQRVEIRPPEAAAMIPGAGTPRPGDAQWTDEATTAPSNPVATIRQARFRRPRGHEAE